MANERFASEGEFSGEARGVVSSRLRTTVQARMWAKVILFTEDEKWRAMPMGDQAILCLVAYLYVGGQARRERGMANECFASEGKFRGKARGVVVSSRPERPRQAVQARM